MKTLSKTLVLMGCLGLVSTANAARVEIRAVDMSSESAPLTLDNGTLTVVDEAISAMQAARAMLERRIHGPDYTLGITGEVVRLSNDQVYITGYHVRRDLEKITSSNGAAVIELPKFITHWFDGIVELPLNQEVVVSSGVSQENGAPIQYRAIYLEQ